MARVNYVDYQNADSDIKQAYDKQKQEAGGYVTNMKRTLLQSLPAYTALMQWYPLKNEVVKFIGERGVSIFCHSISSENECLLCSLYFRKELKEQGISPENFELTEKEEILASLGRQIARDSVKITDDFFSKLKDHFTEIQIINLVAFASLMVATNIVNNTLQIDIDDNIK